MPFCTHEENGNKRCRACDREYQREYRQRVEYKVRELERAKRRRQDPAYVEARRRTSRRHAFKRFYGVTEADVARLHEAQLGRCAICASDLDWAKRGDVHVDHDHETGRVRGLLCRFCNLGLGNFKDNPERLQAAIEYLANY